MWNSELGISHQFYDFINVANVLPSLISIVAKDYSFSNWSLNKVIHEEKHNPKKIECLTNQLFAFLNCKEVFKRILHKNTCLYFRDEVNQSLIVSVNSCIECFLPSNNL